MIESALTSFLFGAWLLAQPAPTYHWEREPLAGGAETGIPRGQTVEEPYDSLSLVPTLLELMGMHTDAPALPGRVIQEILPSLPPTGR